MADRTPIPDEATRLAERYSAAATDYARFWSPVIRPMGQRLVRALPLAGAGRVLDVGTGVGALVPDIQTAAPGAAVVGVDGALGMLRVARASVAIPLAAMDVRGLGFRSGSFDAAVLAFVLFHLPDPVRGLVEIGRVLRPGGALGVTTWGPRRSFAASDVWDEVLAECGAGPDPVDATDRDDLMDTPDKLAALFAEAGFAAVECWSERFAHRWEADTLIAQRACWGSYRRRLDSVDAAARRVPRAHPQAPGDAGGRRLRLPPRDRLCRRPEPEKRPAGATAAPRPLGRWFGDDGQEETRWRN